jgi:L-lactate dehydrogenase complex protein LldG
MAVERDDGRARILGAVRAALGRGPLDPVRARALDARVASPRRNLVPARGQVTGAEAREAFVRWAEAAGAEVVRLAAWDDVPAAVADRLAAANMAPAVRVAPDPRLAALRWDARPTLEASHGGADPGIAAGLVVAEAGIAETGTLVLASGAEGPTGLNFVPDLHLVVLPEDAIVGAMEDAWDRLRARAGAHWPPRTINLVTGPSRTADIEQTMVMGAHGPRRLAILLVPPR